ncbi:unannotated protein [freshwater metagenome]|uniref:Unannotated protein n=1 Tax=freshwater metagenome TaxID=449393 RepID=A0A6J6S3Q5_9ZZZZ
MSSILAPPLLNKTLYPGTALAISSAIRAEPFAIERIIFPSHQTHENSLEVLSQIAHVSKADLFGR